MVKVSVADAMQRTDANSASITRVALAGTLNFLSFKSENKKDKQIVCNLPSSNVSLCISQSVNRILDPTT